MQIEMENHCGDRLPLSYWVGLSGHTIRYYVKKRRYLAGLRALSTTWLFHDNGERCQDCGCRYRRTLWHAPTPLYVKLVGSCGGTLCPACFGKRAVAAGLGPLVWVPTLGVEAWDIHDPIERQDDDVAE